PRVTVRALPSSAGSMSRRLRVRPRARCAAGVFHRPLSGGTGRISQKTGAGGNVGHVGFPGGPVAHADFPALTSLEICAGAGGQALGLEQAGFSHEAVVELDADGCGTLRYNRQWKVIEGDVANVDGRAFAGTDLFAGGVP